MGLHAREHDRRALRGALALTGTFFVVELVGGWLTNSLALLSDAAHMFTDVGALLMGLVAFHVARRSPNESKTYGYHRAEILGALLNGLALWLVVIWIAYAAYGRLQAPPQVHSEAMTIVAVLGLLSNAACAWLLMPREGASLNLRGAFLHVIADLMGSVGAITAGVIMWVTGWYAADAVMAFLIAGLIVVASWGLVREAVDVLMEATPSHIDMEELRESLEAVRGTDHVHDLHVWTLTTGQYALSAHAVVTGSTDAEHVLAAMRAILSSRFHIEHVTIQLEQTQPCTPESVHA